MVISKFGSCQPPEKNIYVKEKFHFHWKSRFKLLMVLTVNETFFAEISRTRLYYTYFSEKIVCFWKNVWIYSEESLQTPLWCHRCDFIFWSYFGFFVLIFENASESIIWRKERRGAAALRAAALLLGFLRKWWIQKPFWKSKQKIQNNFKK